MFSLYESMTVAELAERLDDLDEERTPVGWEPRTATHRASVERRLIDLIGRGAVAGRGGIRCALPVRIRTRFHDAGASVERVEGGAVYVALPPSWRSGTTVEIEIAAADGEPGASVGGTIVGFAPGGLARIMLATPRSEGQERRLRRFVLAALRTRVVWTANRN